ncbi:Halomucin [Frankliniella fusca]|uniref:Halomucin n=1 Tax=Frankliniella fusca TaxID=407009 RepID=A0AAE1HC52_9NEOP|nr:Halomucin [Frankliniella fusca]
MAGNGREAPLAPPWNRAGLHRDRAAAQNHVRLGELLAEARELSDEEMVLEDALDSPDDNDALHNDGDNREHDMENYIGNVMENDRLDNVQDDMENDRPDNIQDDRENERLNEAAGYENINVSGDEGGSSDGGSSGPGNSSSSDEADEEDIGEADRNLNLLENLRSWARHGVSINKVDEMLSILQPHHPFLPKTCRTLLQTPSSGPIQALAGGRFWYKGIMANLRTRVTLEYLQKYNNEIIIDVNMDGIPLHSSNSTHFFPILGCLQGEIEPFIIAIWHGFSSKPNDVTLFLRDYIEEARILLRDGCALFGNNYNFRIRNYILDRDARSFVKCCVGHNSLHACEKCDVLGVYYRRRTTFTSVEFNLRSDDSFRNREDPLHHQQIRSPLEDIGTGMVSQFRLDPLHLIWLGVFKRWLRFIFTERGNFRITDEELEIMCDSLFEIMPVTPSEFARRPRALKRDGNKLKGTELRRLVLYDGLKVFKHLDENIFLNFLLLHSSVYILSSPHLREFLDVANDLIQEFVSHSRRVFGRMFVVYNVHSLRHIVKECEDHGTLQEFDAFKYENYLGVMKRLLRSGYMSLQQVFNRDSERNGHLTLEEPVNDDNIVLSGVHVREGGELVDGVQYTKLQFRRITLALNERDSYFMTSDSEIVSLSNIVQQHDGNIVFIGRKFNRKENAYEFPLQSSLLGIWKVSELHHIRHVWNFNAFSRKCYVMPDNDCFISVPLVHFMQH